MRVYFNNGLIPVEVDSLYHDFDTDELRLTSKDGAERLVLQDSRDPQPPPENEPEDPDPKPDPEPTPGPTPANVVTRHPVLDSRPEYITIPKGTTVASRIEVPEGSTGSKISFQFLNETSPHFDVWISETPGGEPLSDSCMLERANFVMTLETVNDGRKFNWPTCNLKQGGRYYVCIRHSYDGDRASRIKRSVQF